MDWDSLSSYLIESHMTGTDDIPTNPILGYNFVGTVEGRWHSSDEVWAPEAEWGPSRESATPPPPPLSCLSLSKARGVPRIARVPVFAVGSDDSVLSSAYSSLV